MFITIDFTFINATLQILSDEKPKLTNIFLYVYHIGSIHNLKCIVFNPN